VRESRACTQENIEVIDLVVAELREGIPGHPAHDPDIARPADGLPGTQQTAEGGKVVGADDPQRRTAIDRVALTPRASTATATSTSNPRATHFARNLIIGWSD
jgi:hypothetical protein